MEYREVCCCIAVLGVFGILHGKAETITVDTSVGSIVGLDETVTERGKQFQLKSFLGIPYAKPPLGDLRWEKPVPADAFGEPYMATEYGAVCPQIDSPVLPIYKHQSEDCLSLNVYVPGQSADKPAGHAVMVFFHGGGLETGAGSSYIPDSLVVLGNVIVVTINYRVGIFGFLSSGDERIPGNMGFYDQHLALKWVNQNIAAFGGDVSRITIFGQSAGASSVVYQGLYPENKGLFQRIICQSGVPHMSGAINMNPKSQFEFVVENFGCKAESVEESITCLKKMDSKEVLKTLTDLIVNAGQDLSTAMHVHFVVSVDGNFMTKDALSTELSEKAKVEKVPSVEFYRSLDLMMGYMSHDGAFLVAIPGYTTIPDVEAYLPTREEFTTQLVNMPLAFYFGFETQVPEIVKSLVISQYTNWSNPNAPVSNRERYTKLWTDVFFGKGANEFAMLHTNSTDTGNTFVFHFSPPTSMHAIATPSWVEGSNHGDDLGFVFGFNEKTIKGFNESLSTDSLQEWEWTLSDQTIRYWSNFAKSGDPNVPDNSNPTWPQYDIGEQIAMDISKGLSEDSQIRFFDAETNNFWMNTIPAVLEALKEGNESPESIYSQDSNTEGTCDSDKGCENN